MADSSEDCGFSPFSEILGDSKSSDSESESGSSRTSSNSKSGSSRTSSKSSPISVLLNDKTLGFTIDFDNTYGRILLHYLIGVGSGFLAFGCVGAILGGFVGFLVGIIFNILSIPFIIFYNMNGTRNYEMGAFIGIVIGGMGVGTLGSFVGFLLSTIILPITLLVEWCRKQKED